MDYIILDDEATAVSIIEQLCATQDGLTQVGVFSNPVDAIKFLNQNSVDLIFLDVQMPHFSGFDFINTIKVQPKIILTTSDPKFAFQAFEYPSIVDYLVKPIVLDRFTKAINKLRANIAMRKIPVFFEIAN